MAINSILSFWRNPRQIGVSRPARWRTGGAVALAIALSAGGCNQVSPDTAPAGPASACDLNLGACSAATQWGKMQVELTPQPLPVLRPINVTLRFDAGSEVGGKVELVGTEMDMGPIAATLQRVDATTRRAELTIPVCLTGTMQWRLQLQLGEGTKRELVRFDFLAPISPPHPANEPANTAANRLR